MSTGLFFAANLLFCLAYLLRDMAWLRAVTILAATSTLPYFYFQDPPLYVPMGWQIAFILINGFNLTVLLLERRPVILQGIERWLHQHIFPNLTPREMLKVLKPTSSHHYGPEARLVEDNTHLDHLILILEGEARVVSGDQRRATLGPGDFVGEMSFVTDKPTSADVIANTSMTCLQWRRDDLEAMYRRDPRLKDAVQGVVGADMARKLTR